MNPEARLQKVEDLFRSAVKRQPHGLAAFLDEACGEDLDLRREVESLLAYQPKAEKFMETPVAEMAAAVLADKSDAPAAGGFTGRAFGPYVVKTHIGSGGMGDVYLAEDNRLGRKVALRVLSPALSNDSHPDGWQRG